jgi:hypothetical protein
VTAVRVTIRVKPGASRTRVRGDHDGALVVAVTARAVDGRATEAALAALAEAIGLRRRDVILITGATSRTKVVEIADADGRSETISQRIEQLRTGVDG